MKWGYDERDFDTSVRPQDDFYQYSGGGWLARNPIPKTESWWGTFMILRYKTEKQLKSIMLELDATRSLPSGSAGRLVRDFYRSGMDMKRRTQLGITPLNSLRDNIARVTNTEALIGVIAKLHRIGVSAPWGSGVDQDSKDSTQYRLHLFQDGLGMPDRGYYLDEDAESTRVRTAYRPHIEAMRRLSGRSKKEAAADTETILKIETMLAKASMTKEDRRSPEKTYTKMTLPVLKRSAPAISWERYLRGIGTNVTTFIVMQPAFLSAVSDMFGSVSLEEWKVYLDWHLTSEYASHLSPALVRQDFAFYATVLSGAKHMKPLWRRSFSVVNATMGEALGRIYVERHFTKQAKKRMDILVDDLFEAYEARLKQLDWMSAPTKQKALKKLKAFNRKIGYPKRWRSYTGLRIDPKDYVGNVMRAIEQEHKREMRKLGKAIDRDEWFMYPQTVNAYFAPNLNDIVFPAAILQPPFFSVSADDALNYGAIGTVIGHEITHGFDDEGSKFDANGNLKSWWTAEDRARFETKAEIIKKQYDRYEVADGAKVNGKLTLGENIADLGGIAIAFDAYQKRLAKTGRKDMDGYTPEQRFFLGASLFDRDHARPEFQKTQVMNDRHSPGKFRINGPMSNMETFYDAFKVQKGDRMWRPKEERTTVW